jgi:hypothetical protein
LPSRLGYLASDLLIGAMLVVPLLFLRLLPWNPVFVSVYLHGLCAGQC